MTAAANVPQKVASGMFRSGFSTLLAGTVADSSPRNAHKVRIADALIAGQENCVGSAWMTDASPFISSHTPNAMIAISGNSFSTVGDDLQAARLSGAPPVHIGQHPDDHARSERGPAGRVFDPRNQLGEIRDRRDGDGGVADPGADPIAPRREKSNPIAERHARIDIRSAGLWK